MKSVRRLVEKLIPWYAAVPVAAALVWNFLVYYASRLFTTGGPHFSLAVPLDGQVPFWPGMIWLYVFGYVLWAWAYVMAARQERPLCDELFAGLMVSKMLTLLCFLLLPTAILRPELAAKDLSSVLTRAVWAADPPDNLFPSIHCLEAWFAYRVACRGKGFSRWSRAAVLVLALLVCASTVCVRQHTLLDIPGGILAAELGLRIARRFRLGRVFDRIPIE